jgi:hypothetical protein
MHTSNLAKHEPIIPFKQTPAYRVIGSISKTERVSSIYDPQMGKTLARKLESQYVFNK